MLVTTRVISPWRAAPREGLAYLMRGPLTTQTTAAVVLAMQFCRGVANSTKYRTGNLFLPDVQVPPVYRSFSNFVHCVLHCFTGNPVRPRFSDVPECSMRGDPRWHGH